MKMDCMCRSKNEASESEGRGAAGETATFTEGLPLELDFDG